MARSNAGEVVVIETQEVQGLEVSSPEAPAETPLSAIQRELEDHMLGEGGKRFRRRLAEAEAKGQVSTFGSGLRLLREAIEPMERGLAALLSEKRRGRKHLALPWLQLADTEAVAFLTARCVIDGMYQRLTVREVCGTLATLLLDELRYRMFQEKRPALFRYTLLKSKKSTHYWHRKKILDQAIRWGKEHQREQDDPFDVTQFALPEAHRVLIGAKLLDIFMTTTGLVEIQSFRRNGGKKGSKTTTYVVAKPEAREWLYKKNAALEFLQPLLLPMVEPPREWSPTNAGGYRYALRGKYPLIRTYSEHQQAKGRTANMPLVYQAVNAIQATPWRINPVVADLFEEILTRNAPLGAIEWADLTLEPLPAKPIDIATNEEARKRYRKMARRVHENNHRRRTKALHVAKVAQVVRKFRDFERIWFPSSLDFRGRIYPLPHYLHPQADDLAKGLLQFAEGKPVGADGAYWLAVHGANCLDVLPDGTKVRTLTLNERVKWIQQNTARLRQVADDPYADLWWTGADKPVQFFAFCLEWRGWHDAYREGKGNEFVSYLPCAQDGTCNGLQHYSALLRDPVGGRSVNLLPSERPEDVYETVAQRLVADLQTLAADEGQGLDSWFAQKWLETGTVDRKMTKRPTMTFVYGSRQFGMAGQIHTVMQQDRSTWEHYKTLFTDHHGTARAGEASQWIAQRVWMALGSVVVAASQGMEWLQQCARLIAQHSKKHLEWTVPGTGFPVVQTYWNYRKTQIDTVLAGKLYRPMVLTATDAVAVYKQANAIAPNLVHSLDAAALMLTVAKAQAYGLTAFGMVHDSYATHACDCGVLGDLTREAFVHLYRDHDVMGMLMDTFKEQMPKPKEGEAAVELPEPPKPGTLKITDVLHSEYFFN